MIGKKASFIGLVLTILLVCGIFVWRFVVWKVEVFTSAPAPFSLSAQSANGRNFSTFECADTPCLLRLTPGKYTFTVAKEGFFEQRKEVEIHGFAENNIAFELQKIPTITEISAVNFTPKENSDDPYFLSAEGGLFQRNANQNILLAEFPDMNIETLRILPVSTTTLFVLSPEALFEVQIKERRKFKLLTANDAQYFQNALAINSDFVLVENQSNELILFATQDRSWQIFPAKSIALTCKGTLDSNWLFFLAGENPSWEIQKFDQNTQQISEITATSDLGEASEKLWCESDGSLVIQTATKFFRVDF